MNFIFKFVLVFLITINTSYADKIRHHNVEFTVPENMLRDDGYLVRLILQTESMDDPDRQYWFNIYNAPNFYDKRYRLKRILEDEEQGLNYLERKVKKELREKYQNIANGKEVIHHKIKFIVSEKMLINDSYLVKLILESPSMNDIDRQKSLYTINLPENYNKRYDLEESLEKEKKRSNSNLIKSLKKDMDYFKGKLKTEKIGDSELMYND